MIVARVRRSVRERRLFTHRERVLVACSGGPDSATLLHALHRLEDLGLELFAASVDHGLRADAARDVAIAGELAAELSVPFTGLRVEVPEEGASAMAKARRARYAALSDHARSLGASAIAVGHTADDQAETVLARALRGSGVLGLAGIEPRRADGVVRPLIDCARSDVRAHAVHHGLPFVDDPSNVDRAYTRVRIRQDLLPAAIAEDPRAIVHLAALADDARALRALVDEAAGELLARADEGGALDVDVLSAAPAAVRSRALVFWIERSVGATARRAHLDALERTLEGRGDALLPGHVKVRLQGKMLRADLPSGSPGVRSTDEGDVGEDP